jgi:hypothetical protein
MVEYVFNRDGDLLVASLNKKLVYVGGKGIGILCYSQINNGGPIATFRLKSWK